MDSSPMINRRTALMSVGALALAAGGLEKAGRLAFVPQRALCTAAPSDIQFDIAAFLTNGPQRSGTGVVYQMPPVHTVFATARLFRAPTRADRAEMDRDLLFTLRSDNARHISDVLAWFGGRNKLRGKSVASPAWDGLIGFTSSRHMFAQIGLPKAVARLGNLPFAEYIQHQSPMWMGFADRQTNASGPAPICTFAGNSSARLTTARRGDYFDNGSIQHADPHPHGRARVRQHGCS